MREDDDDGDICALTEMMKSLDLEDVEDDDGIQSLTKMMKALNLNQLQSFKHKTFNNFSNSF